ncbi:MAG: beta-ketoacyl-[acyl-carrier-protein] synthase family protein [Ruminococcus sp.]|nr:beta-ketoacyl-[acyl-carrier-protein] synthase family protein [Ruminococcus sp.]
MTKNENRCVVTGLGLISAIGNNVAECWENVKKGVSGIAEATAIDTTDCYAHFAAQVQDDSLEDLPDAEQMDRCVKLCIKASGEALEDAGLTDLGDQTSASVIMGSCIGGVSSVEHYYRNGRPAADVPKIPIAAIAPAVAKTYHAGGVVTNIANACAAGTISIAYACDLIRAGKAEVVIAGGTDALASIPFAGFLSLHALSEAPCSPFNHCSGITLGEGAGAIIIESYAHAMQRKVRIYCEVLGAGISSDAYHITAPRPDGAGQMYAIRQCMKQSGITPAEVDYINAHGTGTAKNDEAEFLSLHTIFDTENPSLSVSSTKSMVGHCLGAAGAVEAVFSIQALTEGIVPPTVGYTEADLPCLQQRAGQMDFCPNQAKHKSLTTVMSNSFAFGGNNASILFSKKPGNLTLPEKQERIYLTGIGVVSPLGNHLDSLIAQFAAKVPMRSKSAESRIDRSDFAAYGLKSSFYRKLDTFSQLQAGSGMQALQDANYLVTDENATDIGIVVGTSDGPLSTICHYQENLFEKGTAGGSAFQFPNTVYNAAGGYLSICSGIRGYHATLTSGIQSGLASLAYAVQILRSGQSKAILATGTDENSEIVTEFYEKLGCFAADGAFHLSDGSTSILLEQESSCRARHATPYAEVLGYGMACKATDFAQLACSESACEQAISLALQDAGISVDEIDGVIGFADGLPVVQQIEAEALTHTFTNCLPVFHVQSIAGEGRAATAALSAAYAALMLSGKLGEIVACDNGIAIAANLLHTLLILSYSMNGGHTAIILSKAQEQEM